MNERRLSNFCTTMLVFSILVRVLLATGAEAHAQTLLSGMLPDRPPQTAEAERVWPVHIYMSEPQAESASASAEAAPEPSGQALPPEAEAPAAAPLCFDAAEADAIDITGACSYEVDKAALLTRPSALDFSGAGPKVLIVHTHTSEAYTQSDGWTYEESDELRTADAAQSIVRVGDEIAAVLESHGIETLHETALNDYPSYNGAYARMETTIEDWLTQYPSIQMVLDVHRDAALDYSGAQLAFTADVSGERCAQVMLVVGTDEGGLTHPDWEENLANALKLQALLNRSAPQLCRSIDLRTERFNQHLTHGSLLAEFGAAGNTLPEAIRAGRLFGEALAALITGLGG